MTLESTLQSAAIRYAVSRGWTYDKIMRTSRNGFPDVYFLRDGRTVLIEFKAPGEQPSPQQVRRHREIHEHGGEVFVVDNLEDAMGILR